MEQKFACFEVLNNIKVNAYQFYKYWMSWNLSILQMSIPVLWTFLQVKHYWIFDLQIKLSIIMNIFLFLFTLGICDFSILSFFFFFLIWSFFFSNILKWFTTVAQGWWLIIKLVAYRLIAIMYFFFSLKYVKFS